ALQRLLRAFDRYLQELQDQRLVGAEHLAGGDAEQERVADVARRARDRHADRCLSHAAAPWSAWGGLLRRGSSPAAGGPQGGPRETGLGAAAPTVFPCPVFEIDPAFLATSEAIGDLALCHLRLQSDARFPWIV